MRNPRRYWVICCGWKLGCSRQQELDAKLTKADAEHLFGLAGWEKVGGPWLCDHHSAMLDPMPEDVG